VREEKVKRKRFQKEPWKRGLREPKRNNVIYGLVSIFTAFLLLVAGCGGGTPPSSLPQKGKVSSLEKTKSEPVKVADKKEPEKKEETEYTYNPAGKVDPFKPFIQISPMRNLSRSGPLTPLQKYEISQLKLVAIISTSEGNIAMVEDSAGRGYILKKGTGIGKNEGKVTKILKDKVIVEETYQDAWGQTKINEIPLLLHRLEEGGES
jgi:type IV pilus assembly protein PilP